VLLNVPLEARISRVMTFHDNGSKGTRGSAGDERFTHVVQVRFARDSAPLILFGCMLTDD
jgi:hypothetical protein